MNNKTPEGLTIAEEQFAVLVASGVSRIDAIRAAYPNTQGWKLSSASTRAWKVGEQPHVRKRIEQLLAIGAEAVKRTIEDVHTHLARIAFADVRELAGVHRDCCRHCWGKGFRRLRTPHEREVDHRAWMALPASKRRGKKFDEEGGVGYDPRRLPNPDCPECHGRGEAWVYVADTRMLSPDGAALFGGAKQGDKGIEIKPRDQEMATDRLARIMGAYAKDNAQPMTEIAQALRELSGNVIGPNPDPRAGDDDDDDT